MVTFTFNTNILTRFSGHKNENKSKRIALPSVLLYKSVRSVIDIGDSVKYNFLRHLWIDQGCYLLAMIGKMKKGVR
jgi:hypothetical protein